MYGNILSPGPKMIGRRLAAGVSREFGIRMKVDSPVSNTPSSGDNSRPDASKMRRPELEPHGGIELVRKDGFLVERLPQAPPLTVRQSTAVLRKMRREREIAVCFPARMTESLPAQLPSAPPAQ